MIDWARVAELKDDLGGDDFAEITSLFMDEVDGCLERLSDDEGRSFTEALHFLKGSAANLGFRALQDLCVSLEAAPDTSKIPQLSTTYAASKQAFYAGCDQKMAG